MRRVAAVDCGTNTIRLLIADLDATSGTERELVREMRVVRLGQDVDRTGRLGQQALERTFDAVDEYATVIDDHDVEALRFCATSASRDAQNSDVFVEGVRSRMGVTPDVLTGEEEAQLSYAGATRGLDRDRPGPVLVVDVGGGSTELILGDGHGRVRTARSLDVGSVRMTERHLSCDPPTGAEVGAATRTIDAALDACAVPAAEARTVVGVAGTATTLAAAVLDLPRYDRGRIHHTELAARAVHETTQRLLAMPVERRRALPYMHPGRADVIGAGALVLDRVLRRTTVDAVLVSEADILDGIAWALT